MKKVISFSLWGEKPGYVIGAVINADIAKEHWEDWTCRFYVAPTVPSGIIEELESRDNVEVIKEDEISNILDIEVKGGNGWEGEPYGMFWRMITASDIDVGVTIIRDVDSQLHIRDKAAVDEWLKSDKDFHIMRDNCQHGFKICGGLWGVKNGGFSNAVHYIKEYIKENIDFSNHDQYFLENVYNIAVKNSFVHDDWITGLRGEEKHPFPIPRLRGEGWWNQEIPEWHSAKEKQTCSNETCGLYCPPSWCTRTPCPGCGKYHDNDYLGKVYDMKQEEYDKYSHLLGVKV